MQNQSKRETTFDTQLKTPLPTWQLSLVSTDSFKEMANPTSVDNADSKTEKDLGAFLESVCQGQSHQ